MLAVAVVVVMGGGALAIRHLNAQQNNNPVVDRQSEFEQIVDKLNNSGAWEESHITALNQLFDMDEDIQKDFFTDPARRTALQEMVSKEHIKDYRVSNALEKFQPVSPSSSETMERGTIIVEAEVVQEAAATHQQAKNVEVVPPQSDNAQKSNNTGRSHYGPIICIDCCYYPSYPYAITPGAQYSGRPYGPYYHSANQNNDNAIICCDEAASSTINCFNAIPSLAINCAGGTVSTAESCYGEIFSAGECLINRIPGCITTTGGAIGSIETCISTISFAEIGSCVVGVGGAICQCIACLGQVLR